MSETPSIFPKIFLALVVILNIVFATYVLI